MIIHPNRFRRLNTALITQMLGHKAAQAAFPAPLARWLMTENSGSTFADSSGNGYTMTLGSGASLGGNTGTLPGYPGVNAPIWNTSIRNAALSGYVSALDFGATKPFTVSSWIYPLGSNGCVIGNYDSTQSYVGWSMRTDYPSTHLGLATNTSNGQALIVYANASIAASVTSFLCATFDGSGLAAGVKLYINGVPQTTSVTSDNITTSAASTSPVTLATVPNQPFVSNMSGYQSDTILFGSVLTAAQIAELFVHGPTAALPAH
jgi:hypothetical protein